MGLLGGSVSFYADIIIDNNGLLKIHGTISTINTGNTTSNKTNHSAFYNENVTKDRALITYINVRLNAFHLNGTRVEVYDYE